LRPSDAVSRGIPSQPKQRTGSATIDFYTGPTPNRYKVAATIEEPALPCNLHALDFGRRVLRRLYEVLNHRLADRDVLWRLSHC
jgi:hypothetical protein